MSSRQPRSAALDAASKQFARRILADSDSDEEVPGVIQRTGSSERKAAARRIAGLAEQAQDLGASPRFRGGSPAKASRTSPKRAPAHAVYRSVSPSRPRTWQESLRHDSPVGSPRPGWPAREGSRRDSGSWTSRNSMASGAEQAAHRASGGWEGRWTAEFEARVPSPGGRRAPVPLTSSKPHVSIPTNFGLPPNGRAPHSAHSLSSLAVLAGSPLYLSTGTTPVQRPSSRASTDGEERPAAAPLQAGAHPAASDPVELDLKSMWARPGAPRAGSAGRCMWAVAHAEPEEGHGEGDPPLSFRGVQHAMECGVFLREQKVARVVCGPSLAEVQTAQYLAWCVGARVCIEPGLAGAGVCLRGPTPGARQRRAYHPSVDASHAPCTREAADEETFIECLPRAVDVAWTLADKVGRGESVVAVASPAIATALASALAAGCRLEGGEQGAGELRRNLASITPVPPCGVFNLLQPGSGGVNGSWLCDLSCARDHLSSPGAPEASFEILLAGEPREWLQLWGSLRKLYRACGDRAKRGGGGAPGAEARLRADVALHAMHMARDALPNLLRT